MKCKRLGSDPYMLHWPYQVVDNIRGLHIHKMIGYIEKPLIQKQGLPQISSCNGKHNTHIEAIFFHCRPVLWAGGDNPFEAIFF